MMNLDDLSEVSELFSSAPVKDRYLFCICCGGEHKYNASKGEHDFCDELVDALKQGHGRMNDDYNH